MILEYVRISPQEKFYSERNLLQAQLEILSFNKHYFNFQELRNEELVLRIILRKKLIEAKELLKITDNLLPKIKMKNKTREEFIEEEIESLKSSSSLDKEIDDIRRKLSRLQG